jgi:hypothetical protein
MGLPGFSAGASLYKTTTFYYLRTVSVPPPVLPWFLPHPQCNVNACLAGAQQYLAMGLAQCQGFPVSLEQQFCVNSYKLQFSNDTKACKWTGCNVFRVCCAGTCVDTISDPSNCGGCSKACAGISPKCCWGECKDVSSDPKNCGVCGAVCVHPSHSSPTCTKGVCDFVCDQGYSRCGNACDNLMQDAQNCGACGIACPGGQSCVNGACSLVCMAPLTTCSGKCVDTNTDASNCGGCNKPCPMMSQACCFGKCTDTKVDPYNCGKCGGNACPASCNNARLCSGGKCVPPSSYRVFAEDASKCAIAGNFTYDAFDPMEAVKCAWAKLPQQLNIKGSDIGNIGPVSAAACYNLDCGAQGQFQGVYALSQSDALTCVAKSGYTSCTAALCS